MPNAHTYCQQVKYKQERHTIINDEQSEKRQRVLKTHNATEHKYSKRRHEKRQGRERKRETERHTDRQIGDRLTDGQEKRQRGMFQKRTHKTIG